MKHLPNKKLSAPHAQRGIVLFVALIALVVMTLAAIALARSVDIATQIAGNLSFRVSGTHASDAGIETARNWLLTTTADLTQAVSGIGYFPTFNGGATGVFDPATFDWATKAPQAPITDSLGNSTLYVIHRMCENTGDPGSAATNCVSAPASGSSGGNSNSSTSYGDFMCVSTYCNASSNPMYRITTRTVGPRNTVTYLQAFLY